MSRPFIADDPATTRSRILDSIEYDTNGGCWLWGKGLNTWGYGALCVNGSHKPAHRLSYEAFKGSLPPGAQVLHRCDVPACVNPEHLFLGSQKDNMHDMANKGRKVTKYGEEVHFAKLSDAEAVYIRRHRSVHAETLADHFGVSCAAIRHVWARRTFKHLP